MFVCITDFVSLLCTNTYYKNQLYLSPPSPSLTLRERERERGKKGILREVESLYCTGEIFYPLFCVLKFLLEILMWKVMGGGIICLKIWNILHQFLTLYCKIIDQLQDNLFKKFTAFFFIILKAFLHYVLLLKKIIFFEF